MKSVIVTGAAGFLGINLINELLNYDVFIYAVVRPQSEHNKRLIENASLRIIELDLAHIFELERIIDRDIDVFFHLAWQGERSDFYVQKANIDMTISTVEVAHKLGCRRYVATGSQAEYGVQNDIICENTLPRPIDDYGAAKLAACILSQQRANVLGIEWIWGRVFSLFGKYEPSGRLLPDLVCALCRNEHFYLSSAKQNWDYLDAREGAKALIALADLGRNGEIYNIASGNYHPLRFFIDEIGDEMGKKEYIHYGNDIKGYNLQPSVKKIECDTGWKSQIDFKTSVKMLNDYYRISSVNQSDV